MLRAAWRGWVARKQSPLPFSTSRVTAITCLIFRRFPDGLRGLAEVLRRMLLRERSPLSFGMRFWHCLPGEGFAPFSGFSTAGWTFDVHGL